MSSRLTLICHAPTAATRAGDFAADEPLDHAGRAKAAALAGTLRRVDAAWSSPALRARQTAEALGVPAAPHQALRDLDVGSWTGRSLHAVAAADPAGLACWTIDPAARPHGGETVGELIGRVRAWLATVSEVPGHGVAVTHAAVVRAALVAVLGAPDAAFWWVDVMPLGRAGFSAHGGRWVVRTLSLASA